ncbi:MAG: IS4 family transposase [Myxococcota bacterium]
MNWNKARLHFLANILLALLKSKTVNLSELANTCSGTAGKESKYRRIQRFLANYPFCFDTIAFLIGGWLPKGQWVLSLDRTNWKFGQTNINFLVLGVVHGGTAAVPLLWMLLTKKGNSNTTERIRLMTRFIKLFGVQRIASLTADREFVGEQWLTWLLEQRIPFHLRIKKNTVFTNAQGEKQPIGTAFIDWPVGTKKRLRNIVIWGCSVHVEGMRLDGDYLIVVSTATSGIIKAYQKRWSIETLFGNLKRRGFHLEDTHLTKPERLSKLFALLSVLLCRPNGAVATSVRAQNPVQKDLAASLEKHFSTGIRPPPIAVSQSSGKLENDSQTP